MKKKSFLIIIIIIVLSLLTGFKYVYGADDSELEDEINNNRGLIGSALYEIEKWIIDFFFVGTGDLFQASINGLHTYTLSGMKNFPTITYNKDEIMRLDDLDKYFNIDNTFYQESTVYKINTDKIIVDEDAGMPLTVVDFYTLATGKVAATDINFLTVNKNLHAQTGLWDTIRNFAVSFMRATIFITAAVLIITLIYHGISVVINVYNPKKKAEHQEGLKRFVKSVLMLVVCILVMALLIFGSTKIIRSILSDSGTDELPIQLNDEKAGRIFSTNITGYFRYKSQSVNLLERFGAALLYLFFAICNFILGLIMVFRFIVLIGYSIYGVILSAMYALKKEEFDNRFLKWIYSYSAITICPIVIAVSQKIVLEVCCSK